MRSEAVYLADGILGAASVRLPSRMRAEVSESNLLDRLLSFGKVAKELESTEIYAFDRSAVNAARDLRIDAPGRLEALVEAVLRSPRKLFIEADFNDVHLIGQEVREALGEEALYAGEASPFRWGAVIDVLGDGRATFQIAYLLPKSWWKETGKAKDFERELGTWPGPMRSWAMHAMGLHVSSEVWEIDLSRKAGMSKAEFRSALEKIKESRDPIFQHAQRAMQKDVGVRAISRIVNAGWQATRFRDLVRRSRLDTGAGIPLEAEMDVRAAHSQVGFSYGLPIIAMLAVLQADSSDIRTSPRKTHRMDKKRKNKPAIAAREKEIARSLNVVTLNLEDRDLQQIYEGREGEDDRILAGSIHSGRLRHPVRGHLFLARNGKMTWRRPHWRGSLDQTTIRRVIAPSHG